MKATNDKETGIFEVRGETRSLMAWKCEDGGAMILATERDSKGSITAQACIALPPEVVAELIKALSA